jgi:hypothetical protein
MAGIERGPQTVGPGQQGSEPEDMPGTPFEESEDAERLAKLPEHERDDVDKPAEGGLVSGGAAGIPGGAAAVGDYAGRLNVPVAVKNEETPEEEAAAQGATDKEETDRRG